MNGSASSSTSRNGAMAPALPQVEPLSEPSVQNVMSRSWRSSAMKISKPDRRLRQRADREPGQQQRGDRGAALARREAVEHRGGDERAEERGDRQRRERQRDPGAGEDAVAEHDGGGGGERGARGYADQAGLGQRIAEQALHDGARGRQHRADHAGHGDARQADRPQHQPVALDQRRVAGREAGGRQQPRQRNAGGADGGGDRRHDDEDDAQHR